jgi:molybdenum cofactor guanylyltransferase
MTDACAFVLAGGRSSRMGRDKALLRFGDSTLLEQAMATARAAVRDVRIVGSRAIFQAFGETVEDQFPGCGPLSGIHAALRCSDVDYNLILAVDMPFLSSAWLRYLLEQARRSHAVATFARDHAGSQPLCAVYRREFAEVAEAALRAGRYRIDALFTGVPARVIDRAELARENFSPELFRNLNTLEEFERATLVKKD